MVIKILIALAVIVIGLVAVVARRPSDFRIVRTATMAASAPAVFAQVNDFHRWQVWSPWAKRDPGMKQTYGGAQAGTGATYAWAGNREVGEGRMTLVESRPRPRHEHGADDRRRLREGAGGDEIRGGEAVMRATRGETVVDA